MDQMALSRAQEVGVPPQNTGFLLLLVLRSPKLSINNRCASSSVTDHVTCFQSPLLIGHQAPAAQVLQGKRDMSLCFLLVCQGSPMRCFTQIVNKKENLASKDARAVWQRNETTLWQGWKWKLNGTSVGFVLVRLPREKELTGILSIHLLVMTHVKAMMHGCDMQVHSLDRQIDR